jgi:hypothetical protein
VMFKKYRSPEASIGLMPLGLDAVLGVNLKSFREASGYPIEGILGMDFMGRCVVRIDFDRGELLLLKSVPKDSGEVVPIRWNQEEWPTLDAWISPQQKVEFLIDTGRISRNSGEMEGGLLRQNGDFKKVGSTLMETVSGTHTSLVFRGRLVAIGGFSVPEPIFNESPTLCLLGLGFWSRFVVTFDFPNRNMYLRKGKEYLRPDLRDLSGLHLLKRNGAVVIDSVDRVSPGASEGIQTGDVLVTLSNKRADETTLFEIRKVLSQSGPLGCSLRRGSQEYRVTLNLPR